MQINVTYDQSQSSLPAGFVTAINYVANYYDTLFTNNVTINIDIGYGEIDGQALGSNDLGESLPAANNQPGSAYSASYSAVESALVAENAPGASTLPSSSPLAGTMLVTAAEAKALGLISTNGGPDGYVGFSKTLPFSYTPNATPAANQYYFVGVVEHEISEDMGRVSLLNDQPSYYSPIDLFRYSSAGVRDLTTGGNGSTAYFSINNGATNLGSWNNQVSNGDLADWYPSGPAPGGNDAYNDYSSPGAINVVSANDITLMEALGWTTTNVPLQMQLSAATNSGVPAGDITRDSSPVMVGTGEPGDTVTLYVNGNEVGVTAVGSNDSWSVAVGTLAFGTYSLEAIETLGGQTVATSTYSLTIAETVGNVGDFFGAGAGETVFVRSGNGQLEATEFNASGQVLDSAAFTINGAPVEIDSATTVVGGGGDFFGLRAGDTAFLRSGSGQLVAWEFNGSGQLTDGAFFTINGAPVEIDTATTMVGGGGDFFGLGAGDTAFLRSGSGQLVAWEFNGSGQLTDGAFFTINGAPVEIDTATTMVGGGEDFFGLGGGDHTAFLRSGSGQLVAWEFNGSGQLTDGAFFTINGAPVEIDTATSVIGGGEDFFGLGAADHTAFLRSGGGQLVAWEFNGSDQLTDGAFFTINGAPVEIDTATSVVGGGEDFFGLGTADHTAFLRSESGQLVAWEFNGSDQLVDASFFTTASGAPFVIDTATSVIAAQLDSSTGLRELELQDGTGQPVWWDFSGSSLINPHSAAATNTTLTTDETAASNGTLSFGNVESTNILPGNSTAEGSSSSLALDPASAYRGSPSAGLDVNHANDQFNFSSGETVAAHAGLADTPQAATDPNQTLSVSVGGPGNDNFVFQPGIGAETVTNFNPQADTIELDNFANAQSMQELASLITTDSHGNAVIELGHGNSITLPGMDGTQLQQVLASVVHLQ